MQLRYQEVDEIRPNYDYLKITIYLVLFTKKMQN
jgi:hypothetical protein